MGFFELVAVSATEALVDRSFTSLGPVNKYALQFTRAFIDCIYLYTHSITILIYLLRLHVDRELLWHQKIDSLQKDTLASLFDRTNITIQIC